MALKLEKYISVGVFSFLEKMHQIIPLVLSLRFFKTMILDLFLCALHQSFPCSVEQVPCTEPQQQKRNLLLNKAL